MPGVQLVAISALILLLLPIVILEWESYRVPDWLYMLLAGSGVVFSLLQFGFGTAIIALLTAALCLLLIGSGVAYMRRAWKLRFLSGGQIKLLAAGSAWLGPVGAILMLILAILSFTIFVLILRVRKKTILRPDSEAIAAIAILVIQVHQGLATF